MKMGETEISPNGTPRQAKESRAVKGESLANSKGEVDEISPYNINPLAHGQLYAFLQPAAIASFSLQNHRSP